jgi:hypothetical protein
MTTQTEAERLANGLERDRWIAHGPQWCYDAAAELRRLVSFNQQLMDEVARLQKREWVGLTDAEKYEAEEGCSFMDDFDRSIYADNIEAKLKAKNERKEKNQ